MTRRVKPVFSIGDNIISSLGFTTQENMRAVLAGKTGLTPTSDASLYPETFFASTISKLRMNALVDERGLRSYPDIEAWMILSIEDALMQAGIDASGQDTVLIFSTTKGNVSCLSGKYPPETTAFLWKTAQSVCRYFRMKNHPLVVSNACVSGVYAIELAARLLRAGRYTYAIVVGADRVSGFTVSGFQSFKSISSLPCKPFDKQRDGLSIGEAAATLILTNDPLRYDRQRSIYIRGGATSNDANHISGPSRTGDGLSKAIEEAIRYAGVQKDEIDFINLHGTATVYNDEMESKALALSGLSGVWVNSLKGYWGHTLGASGVVETIASMESLRRNKLIATLGFSSLGVSDPLRVIDATQDGDIRTCLKVASGFGGFNSAMVLSKECAGEQKKSGEEESLSTKTVRRCAISKRRITLDSYLVYEDSGDSCFLDFIKTAFKRLNLPYAKFYKMDNLSKLGFVAMQYLIQDFPEWEYLNKKKVALLFSNSVSSLDTDIKHQQSIADSRRYFPSPSVFVYTLPNIVLGEICIKEKIQGETAFFVSEQPDPDFAGAYARLLFETTDTDAIVIGRTDCLGENYKAELYLMQRVRNTTKKS